MNYGNTLAETQVDNIINNGSKLFFRKLPLWERIYCWVLIVVGLVGGASATYTAINNVFGASFSLPCYVKPFIDGAGEIEVSASH